MPCSLSYSYRGSTIFKVLKDIYCFYVVLHGLNDNKYFSKAYRASSTFDSDFILAVFAIFA